MPFLIGTDEAGYGPNLGPLLITATCWKTDTPDADLYDLLSPLVVAQPQRKKKSNVDAGVAQTLLIADSKVVYRGKSIQSLERAVLATLSLLHGTVATDLRELTKQLQPTADATFFDNEFWLCDQAVELPLKNSVDEIADTADAFLTQCESANVKLCSIDSAIVLPPDFNESIQQQGNKANVLSQRTLGIVERQMRRCRGDLVIDCDKHGGRSSYRPLIEQCLTPAPVSVHCETAAQSVYRWQDQQRNTEIRFTAKGEGQLSVALASMVSKYVREVYMEAWNGYWRHHQSDLKPTKGYPQDAKRFRLDIAQTQKRLGIQESQYWRCR